MLTNMDLYGTDDVPLVPAEVCDPRIKLLQERLKKLMEVHWMERDNHLVDQVVAGITFWKRLRDGEEGI